MRCPRCNERAIGLLAWYGHQMVQPLWEENRYYTRCRQCGAELRPVGFGDLPGLATMLVCGGAALAITAVFGLPTGPYNAAVIAAAFIGGPLLHYPIARYRLVDSETAGAIPTARVDVDDRSDGAT